MDAEYRKRFSEKMQEKGLKLQEKTLKNLNLRRTLEDKLKKCAPPDELAKEWFNEDKMSVDTRAYVLDKVMPSIVPGLEALLKEVEKKKVLEEDNSNFDPLKYIGEYLMRNNPNLDMSTQAHPYVRGLKEVLQNLQEHVFDLEFNRLGQLKEELREVQNQRAQVENIQSQVQERRKEALSLQFQEWTLDVTGRIPLALVQGSFTSFFEIVPQLPLDGKPAYNMEKEVVYTMEQKLNEEEFVEYLYPLIRDFSTDVFQEFLHHLAQCADMFHETIRHDIRRRRFSDLFLECDPGKVGFLDRQRVLALMESFYDNMYSESEEWQLRNPRQWPVIDISEMDPEDFWANFQEVEQHTEEKDDDSRSLLLEPSEGNTQTKGKHTETESTVGPGDGGRGRVTEYTIKIEGVEGHLESQALMISNDDGVSEENKPNEEKKMVQR